MNQTNNNGLTMNSKDQVLKYKKHKIYQIFIFQIAFVTFLFTGHHLHAGAECDYSYFIFSTPNDGKIIKFKHSFELECKWNKQHKLWFITQNVKIQHNGHEYKGSLGYGSRHDEDYNRDYDKGYDRWWNGYVFYKDNKLQLRFTGAPIPIYMQIVDNTGLKLDYSRCNLQLTFENPGGELKETSEGIHKINGKFDETCFGGYLNDDAGNTYQLSHIQWIMWPKDKYKPKLAFFMLQAEIEEEIYTQSD